jgi:hypothetical protein
LVVLLSLLSYFALSSNRFTVPRIESGTREYDVEMLASIPQRTVKFAEEGKGDKKEEK